jgi:hypothetical protein
MNAHCEMAERYEQRSGDPEGQVGLQKEKEAEERRAWNELASVA